MKYEGDEYDRIPRAAVALILRTLSGSDDLFVLLVKRRVMEHDPWSGHMAFPGGRFRSQDGTLLSTVKREVHEETGIDLSECELFGGLDEVLPGNVSIRVTPFVFLASENIQVKIEESEIVDYFWIPLGFFKDKKNYSTYSIERFGKKADVPSYPYLGKHVIWGMTLRIIESLLARID